MTIKARPKTAFIITEVDERFVIQALGCGGIRQRIAMDFAELVEILRDERNNDAIAHQKHVGELAHI